MKRKNLKRPTVLLALYVLVIMVLGTYAIVLQRSLTRERQAYKAISATLSENDAEANKTSAYIDTICAEYRKLYQSDRQLRYANQPNVDKYIGLPGSAKGNIDKCYLPE